ncbi:UDP-N-acetylglucosamine 2-epimerase [Bacillus thermophilus]|uniref:UDP-N-acetylglucosamine 2-epimerase n=1 Tax=Siminovitchia thermophila TaxID=1245522 RepID=A0ABS2R6D6_9BACI|nr:UDP-N-acetylglucosamine 2-epimerase [Siminovitchia thermophila]MBM7714960.1 UDP-N-acetylglucosamine 2-epimerase [Siminovitchia thermophila]
MEVPCVTLREQTEWVETLESEANIVGTDTQKIVDAVYKSISPNYEAYFGEADASKKIVELLSK